MVPPLDSLFNIFIFHFEIYNFAADYLTQNINLNKYNFPWFTKDKQTAFCIKRPIKHKARAIRVIQSRLCCKNEIRNAADVIWDCPEISCNPGLYLAVIPEYKSDLRPVFSTLLAAALASWRGRAAIGVPPTWAAPPPAGRSSETRRPVIRQSSVRHPEPGTDRRDFSKFVLVWAERDRVFPESPPLPQSLKK